jgi:hypothetical protein
MSACGATRLERVFADELSCAPRGTNFHIDGYPYSCDCGGFIELPMRRFFTGSM